MAMQLDPSVKDDLKTQFVTREGTYRLMTLSEYSRPNRVGYTNSQSSPQVRVSIVTLPNAPQQASNSSASASGAGTSATVAAGSSSSSQGVPGTGPAAVSATATAGSNSIESRLHGMHMNEANGMNGAPLCGGDRICFNFGKELYVYAFRGVKKGSELSKPIDKKLYKGTNPSCHDFNATTATPDGAPLLVGFTTGQIQLAQPGRQPGKLYNEERLIDKTKVTCLKWLPGSPNLFLASHASGHLYLYNEELPCTPTAPNYQPFKMGDGYTILTCKSKSTRNPLYKWVFGTENCSINEFSFSPCGSNLAIVSQDGFLRVFHYDTMELLGIARSYFGGFLCVCWSPDGKYIVVGGEDDLVTVWSLHERRVVARGQGHRSWVSVVAFDPYTTSYTNWDGPDFSDDENPMSGDYRYCNNDHSNYDLYDCEKNCNGRRPNSASFRDSLAQDKLATSYRLGSVSQDTQLCLWDITEDVLRHPLSLRQRLNSNTVNDMSSTTGTCTGNQLNGDVLNEVKVIKPIATTNATNNTNNKDDNSCNISSKNSSNSSSSKFSTANCTMSSSNDSGGGGGGLNNSNCNSDQNNKNSTSSISNKQNSNKQTNCVGNNTVKSDTTANSGMSADNSTTANNKSSSGSSSKSSDSSSGLSAFNSLTQRLSNFTFGSEKKSSTLSTNEHHHHHHSHQNNSRQNHHHRKTFSLSKSSGSYHSSSLHHSNFNGTNLDGGNSLTSLKNSKSSQSSSGTSTTISSYDPMKLIGTPACPRFDECPLLEPLICKKIAHERLTALIFREDCFLTACQDGFIYTWARPGYSNVPQHMSPSPSAPPGGTVV